MQAYRYAKLALLATLILFVTSSCHRRGMVDIYGDTVRVDIHVDWVKYNAPEPQTMSVACLPANGLNADAVTFTTDNLNFASVNLQPGEWDIIVYSNSYADYDCYEFSTIDKAPFIRVKLLDGSEPKPFGLAYTHIAVPNIGIVIVDDDQEVSKLQIVETETLYPTNMLWTGKVTINVNGIDDVAGLDGDISGFLKDNFGLPEDADLTNVTINDDGTITADFYCLGFGQNWTGAPDDNTLDLDFQLKDGSEDHKSIEVGDKIVVNNEDNTITLTVTTSVRRSQGGYDVDVEPWQPEIIL